MKTTTLKRLAALLLLMSPLLAQAAGASGSLVTVDLRGGVVGAWLGTTLKLAWGALPFMLLVSLLVEGAKAPTAQRDFGAVVWRMVIVIALLTGYSAIFSTIMEMTTSVANQIAPADTWAKLQDAVKAFSSDKAKYQMSEVVNAAKSGSASDVALAFIGLKLDTMGGEMIDIVVTLILLIGQATFRIQATFGSVLAMLLYVLGPISIVLSVPQGSDLGNKWFRVLASVLAWPIISALIVGLLVEYGLKALKPQSSYDAAFDAIILAGLLCVCSFAVPTVASALLGSSMGALGTGFASMQSWMAGTIGRATTGATALAGAAGLGVGAQVARSAGRTAAESIGGGGGGGFSDVGGSAARAGGLRGGGSAPAHAGVGSAAPMQEPLVAFGRVAGADASPGAQKAEKSPVLGGAAAEFERPAPVGIDAIAPNGVPEGNRMELGKPAEAPTHRGPDAGLQQGEGAASPAWAEANGVPTPRVAPAAAAALQAAARAPAGSPAPPPVAPVQPVPAPNPVAQRVFDKAQAPREEYQARRAELLQAYARHGGNVDALAQEWGKPAHAVRERLERFNVGAKDLQPPPFRHPPTNSPQDKPVPLNVAQDLQPPPFRDPQERPTQKLPPAVPSTPRKKGDAR